MKYEIVKKSHVDSYGDIDEYYKIRRKYWLYNSYHHKDYSEPEYVIPHIIGGIIILGISIGMIASNTYLIPGIINISLLYLLKFLEKYSGSSYSSLRECEKTLDNLVKIGSSNKKTIVKIIDIKKDAIYIDRI